MTEMTEKDSDGSQVCRMLLVAHTDSDNPSVFAVPEQWELGRDFELCVNAIILPCGDRDALRVPILRFEKLHWAVDRETSVGDYQLRFFCWAQIEVECSDEILFALLDETIAKHFSISLLASNRGELTLFKEGMGDSECPEIAVFRPNSSPDAHEAKGHKQSSKQRRQ